MGSKVDSNQSNLDHTNFCAKFCLVLGLLKLIVLLFESKITKVLQEYYREDLMDEDLIAKILVFPLASKRKTHISIYHYQIVNGRACMKHDEEIGLPYEYETTMQKELMHRKMP